MYSGRLPEKAYPSCWSALTYKYNYKTKQLECGPMPNMMVALPNTGGAPLFNAAKFG